MRQSRVIMGTGVSIDIPVAKREIVFDDVFRLLADIDERFSPYKADSEVSRYAKGDISKWRLSWDMRSIIRASKRAEKETNGAFSAWAGGSFDPSGYVKGWAIDKAAKLIESYGVKTYCISIGGDIRASSDSDKTWTIGLQHPSDKKAIMGKVPIKTGAIATSGNYERGEHIINPKTGKPAKGLKALTVIGPKIIEADVLATAGFVLGEFGVNFIAGKPGYEAIAVTDEDKVIATPGAEEYLV